MITYPNSSYTSGASNAQPSHSPVQTVGPEMHTITTKKALTSDTLSEGWIQEALGKLNEIADLGPDWDTYGGDPPSPLAIAMARRLLLIVYGEFSRLAYEQSWPQAIAPRADGGVQIEWGTRPVEIAVHTNPSGGLGYLYVDQQSGTPEYKEVPSASFNEVLQLIAKVMFAV